MPNTERLNKTVKEIEDSKFKWEQSSWTMSRRIFSHEQIAFEDLPNECGTSYCFAGRVASLKRELLFESFAESNGYVASMYFIPLEGEQGDEETGPFLNFLYRAVKDQGKVTFQKYEGQVISARGAAIRDLEITGVQGDALFCEFNDLNAIKDVVDRIVNGDSLDEDELEGWDDEYN